MKYVEHEEFESGDKVRLGSWVDTKDYMLEQLNSTMVVDFQDGDDVYTDRGRFDFDCLEYVGDVLES